MSTGGVIRVVTMTMITTAEKTSTSMTGLPCRTRAAPMPAKIRPTSPRGTMPTATEIRSRPRSTTPRAQIILPMIAAKERRAANPSTSTRPKVERSTLIPIRTKKIGTRKMVIGWISSSRAWSPRSRKSL